MKTKVKYFIFGALSVVIYFKAYNHFNKDNITAQHSVPLAVKTSDDIYAPTRSPIADSLTPTEYASLVRKMHYKYKFQYVGSSENCNLQHCTKQCTYHGKKYSIGDVIGNDNGSFICHQDIDGVLPPSWHIETKYFY